jgi:hypothetical protein
MKPAIQDASARQAGRRPFPTETATATAEPESRA